MNKKEIKILIEKGESERVEFKTSLSEWKEAVKTLVAFSWIKGGIVIFGISNSGKILGVEIGKGTIEELANNIKQKTDPKIYPNINILEINNKNIILVEIGKISDEPILFFGRAYKRVGKSTHQLSRDEYKRVIRDLYEQEFDGQVCEKASLKDIDWDFVKNEFIPLYEKISERKVEGEIKELLESLSCIRNNKPTNAGILLFGKKPQKFFMNSYIALARYRGDVEDAKRLDYKEFEGNLFQQIDNCNRYIRDHIAVMSRLEPGEVRREDIPEYGFFSIRELITNAVCHRDYSEQGSKVIIKMFDNRIDYYNPGGLSRDITPQNIIQKQYSRNPMIAKVLSKVEYIEELGEGWNKIIKEHKEHSLKPELPKINADKSSMLVSLFSTKGKFEEGKEGLVLNERQRKAIEYLKENNSISISKYMILNNVSDKTARRDLGFLIMKGFLIKEGVTTNLMFKLRSTSVNFGQNKNEEKKEKDDK